MSRRRTHTRRPAGLFVALWILAILILPHSAAAQIGEKSDKSLANQFLVASETMADPRFSKTVIYMCRHTPEGAFGLIINRPLGKMPIRELLEPLGIGKKDDAGPSDEIVNMRVGGPVDFRTGFILHSDDFKSKAPICRHGALTVTADSGVLQAISNGEGPKRKIIFFGYAGWGAGQLESELAQNAWTTEPAQPELMFADNIETIWEQVIKRTGIDL
jgi:putative transcriptional regulator